MSGIRHRTFALLVAGALLLAAAATAQAGPNSGAAFLRIGAGARPAALGGAYTAIADDVDALYYNPGGLSRITRPEVGATHVEWLLDTRFDFIGYAHPTAFGTFGLGVTRFGTGAQQGRAIDRTPTGDFGASDTALSISFGRRLLGTGMGLSLKYLESRIGSASASTLAFDVGAVRSFSDSRFSLGLALLNLGRGMRFIDQTDPLPLTLAVGAAYRFAGILQLALDVRHEPYDRRTDVGVGTEYSAFGGFSLRAGYTSAVGQVSAAGRTSLLDGLGGGFGLRLGRYRVDYTFTPFGSLGNTQRISLGARF